MTTRHARTIFFTIIAGAAFFGGLLCTVVYAKMHIWFSVAEMQQAMVFAAFAGFLVSFLCGIMYLVLWEDKLI
jgi:hypothetical protein